jgi:hypothetical protein
MSSLFNHLFIWLDPEVLLMMSHSQTGYLNFSLDYGECYFWSLNYIDIILLKLFEVMNLIW